MGIFEPYFCDGLYDWANNTTFPYEDVPPDLVSVNKDDDTADGLGLLWYNGVAGPGTDIRKPPNPDPPFYFVGPADPPDANYGCNSGKPEATAPDGAGHGEPYHVVTDGGWIGSPDTSDGRWDPNGQEISFYEPRFIGFPPPSGQAFHAFDFSSWVYFVYFTSLSGGNYYQFEVRLAWYPSGWRLLLYYSAGSGVPGGLGGYAEYEKSDTNKNSPVGTYALVGNNPWGSTNFGNANNTLLNVQVSRV